MNRRAFLKSAASAAASVPFHALLARAEVLSSAGRIGALRTAGYGPLVPALDETTGLPLLKLPEGFRYLSFGWAGDAMGDGQRMPGKHDGMGAFAAGPGRVRLVRNHEEGSGTPFSQTFYDPAARGGTASLDFDTDSGTFIGAHGNFQRNLAELRGRRDTLGLVADV